MNKVTKLSAKSRKLGETIEQQTARRKAHKERVKQAILNKEIEAEKAWKLEFEMADAYLRYLKDESNLEATDSWAKSVIEKNTLAVCASHFDYISKSYR